jgi:hypothetical protein
MNPNQAYYSSANAGGGGNRKRLLLVIALVVIIVGAMLYIIFGGNNNGDPDNNNDQETGQETEGGTFPLSNLNDFDFIAPDMKGLVRRTDFTIDVGDYTTTDNACNIQFGVVPAVELPGLTPSEIAATHLGASESTGAVGAEPRDGKNLELKATKGNATYTMPTMDYAYTRDNVNYKASYSVVILKDNKRAFIRRYCANGEGSVSTQKFNAINDKAKQLKIRVEEE